MYLVKTNEEFRKLDSTCMFVNTACSANWVFHRDLAEKNLIDWCIQNFSSPSKDFIDVGSHIGSYSWSLAPHFSKVWAFECNPAVYNCLCANIFLKGFSDKITAQRVGLSSRTGIAEYYFRSPDGGGNGITVLSEADYARKKMQVELRTLDSLNIKNVGFMKIDVEGHEKEVLQGSMETLQNNNYPPFIFESWREGLPERPQHAAELRSDLFDFVRSLDYNIIEIMGYPEMFLAVHKTKN